LHPFLRAYILRFAELVYLHIAHSFIQQGCHMTTSSVLFAF
jgi:hypothetical protein